MSLTFLVLSFFIPVPLLAHFINQSGVNFNVDRTQSGNGIYAMHDIKIKDDILMKYD